MDETPNKQPEASGSSEGESINQDDIDALINGDSGSDDEPMDCSGADASSDAASGDSGTGAIGQDDVDALINGGGEATPPEPASDDASAVDSSGAINQEDIDVLLNAAGSGGDAPGTGPASETSVQATDARVDSLGRPFDETAAAMQAAIEEERAAAPASTSSPDTSPDVRGFEMPDLGGSSMSDEEAKSVSMLNDVNLHVKLQLGRTEMLVEDVLKLGEGSVVELDKLAGDPVDVLINDRLIARGEVLVLNDVFCVRISEVLANDPHRVTT